MVTRLMPDGGVNEGSNDIKGCFFPYGRSDLSAGAVGKWPAKLVGGQNLSRLYAFNRCFHSAILRNMSPDFLSIPKFDGKPGSRLSTIKRRNDCRGPITKD
jgi:hypothetical protein